MPQFDSAGVRIHYEVFGEGKPILMVHGFTASLESNWVRPGWVETLSPIRQVVALDCRGHGKSGKPYDPQAYAGHEMEDDVIRLMDLLSIELADLFGYSMGARIAFRLMLRHPQRFTSVVLGGIGADLALRGGGRPNVVEALLAEDPSKITDPVGKGFRIVAEASKNDLKALAAYQQATQERITEADLLQVTLPVLIVIGEDDAIAGSPDVLANGIPNARLIKIPEREHLTVVPDARFKEAVVGFLTEQPAG